MTADNVIPFRPLPTTTSGLRQDCCCKGGACFCDAATGFVFEGIPALLAEFPNVDEDSAGFHIAGLTIEFATAEAAYDVLPGFADTLITEAMRLLASSYYSGSTRIDDWAAAEEHAKGVIKAVFRARVDEFIAAERAAR